MNNANIQELISGKGFIMVNKGLAKHVGLTAATIYGELVSTFLYWKDRGELTYKDDKQWFFCTIEDLEEKTTVKKDAQSKAIKTLEKEGFIISQRFGLPARRYFHITDKYVQILIGNYFSEKPQSDNSNDSGDEDGQEDRSNQISKKTQTGIRENRKLDSGKTNTNNKALNNKQINKKQQLSIDNYQVMGNLDGGCEKENQKLSPESFKKEFIKVANNFYQKFALGRWSKETWTKLIERAADETIQTERYKNVPGDKLPGYVYKILEKMADHHDYKKEYEVFAEKFHNQNTEPTAMVNPVNELYYNWLDEDSPSL